MHSFDSRPTLSAIQRVLDLPEILSHILLYLGTRQISTLRCVSSSLCLACAPHFAFDIKLGSTPPPDWLDQHGLERCHHSSRVLHLSQPQDLMDRLLWLFDVCPHLDTCHIEVSKPEPDHIMPWLSGFHCLRHLKIDLTSSSDLDYLATALYSPSAPQPLQWPLESLEVISPPHKRSTLAWGPLGMIFRACPSLKHLDLTGINVQMSSFYSQQFHLQPFHEPASFTSWDDDKVVDPFYQLTSLTMKHCTLFRDVKRAIVRMMPNIQDLQLVSVDHLWDETFDEEFKGDISPFPSLERVKLDRLMDEECDTLCSWIRKGSSLRSLSIERGHQSLIMLAQHFDAVGVVLDELHIRYIVPTDGADEILLARCCRQLRSLSHPDRCPKMTTLQVEEPVQLENQALTSPLDLSWNNMDMARLSKYIPYTKTLTHLSLGMSRNENLELVHWTLDLIQQLRWVILQVPQLQHLGMSHPLEDLVLFEDMGRSIVPGAGGTQLTESTLAEDWSKERPFLSSLSVCFKVNEGALLREDIEAQLWRRFRFLETLKVKLI